MTYEELVDHVRRVATKARISKLVGHVAYQFNVVGEAEGIFYLEIVDGRVKVEPYDYYDRNVLIITSAKTIMEMLSGRLQPMLAFTNGQIQVYGEVDQLKVLPFGHKQGVDDLKGRWRL